MKYCEISLLVELYIKCYDNLMRLNVKAEASFQGWRYVAWKKDPERKINSSNMQLTTILTN